MRNQLLLALCLLFTSLPSAYAAPLQSASLHNVIRQALNNQTTLDNLGVYLDQSYDFSQEPKPSPALVDMQDDASLLADVEQFTSQCFYRHPSDGYGSNLFAGTGDAWTLQAAINAWADEARDYDYDSDECAADRQCKHYTQIMWENTTSVACAVQRCDTMIDSTGSELFDGRSGTLIICGYAPPGNVVNTRPYRTETGLNLSIKTLLQGAYNTSTGNMRDDLRANQQIPTTEPYSQLGHNVVGNKQLNTELLSADGENAIVDWILLELRDKTNPSTIVTSAAALLQKGGDIVDPMTGSDVLSITGFPADSYYIAVRHRNHLGVMTSQAMSLSNATTSIDFSDENTPVFGLEARRISDLKAMMWAGDANHDGKLIASGPQNDVNSIFSDILLEPSNTGFNSNYILSSYRGSDLNLDGQVIYVGNNNDENIIRGNILLSPNNSSFSGNYIVDEQLPK